MNTFATYSQRLVGLLAIGATLTVFAQAGPDSDNPPPPRGPRQGEPDGAFEKGRPTQPGQPGQPFGPNNMGGPQRGPGRGPRQGNDPFASNNRPPVVEPRVVVMNLGRLDAAGAEQMDADLNVMRVILQRVVEDVNGQRTVSAMGIPLSIHERIGRHEALFIEDYGVLFRLYVAFPLSPEAGVDDRTESRQRGSVWEQARREYLYQNGGVPGDIMADMTYEAGRNRRLQQSLVTALKHSANMRLLKPEDRLTISVSSVLGRRNMEPGQRPAREGAQEGNTGSQPKPMLRDEPGLRKEPFAIDTLVITTTKADVDALAEGKIDGAEFEKRVRVRGSWETTKATQ